MTALVGRVPIQGQVRDPMPFKVITGKENLAANGLRIPGIEVAVRDSLVACVWRGRRSGQSGGQCGECDSRRHVGRQASERMISMISLGCLAVSKLKF